MPHEQDVRLDDPMLQQEVSVPEYKDILSHIPVVVDQTDVIDGVDPVHIPPLQGLLCIRNILSSCVSMLPPSPSSERERERERERTWRDTAAVG